MVTHDATAAYLATRVLEIADGQILNGSRAKTGNKSAR
jgi:ABC-type lipoprotein export system ATPase subunit